jgi:hypothetical protein
MPAMTTWPAFFVSVALVIGAGCAKDKDGKGSAAGSAAAPVSGEAAVKPGAPPEKDGIEGLAAFIDRIRGACATKDFATGKKLVLGAIPSPEDVKKVLLETVPLETLDKISEFYKQLPPSDEQVACLFSPDPARKEVRVYGSSVEELRAYEDGTLAYKEFPGGAKDAADKALRPGGTFYEIEIAEPGNDSGTKFHLFFWNGQHWKMLGPIWRAFQ